MTSSPSATTRNGDQDASARTIMSPFRKSSFTSSRRPSYRVSCERHPYTLGQVMFDDDDDSDSDEEADIPSSNNLSSPSRRGDREMLIEAMRKRLAEIEQDLSSAVTQTSGSKHNLPLDETSIRKKNAQSNNSESSLLVSTTSSKDLEQRKQGGTQDAR